MKHLSWILTLPLLVVAVVFSIVNQAAISISLWPFGAIEGLPLYLIFLVTLFIGFLIGGLVMWLSGGRARRRAREARFQATHLEREVIRLKREAERSKAPPAAAPPKAPSVPAVASGR